MSGRLLSIASAALATLAIVAPTADAQLNVPYGNEALAQGITNEALNPTALAGGNNWLCRPSSAHPYPVVLVHATAADEGSNWVTLAPLLANAGYCVFGFNYGESILSFGGRVDGLSYIEQSAEELRSFVSSVLFWTGASKVDLVGHSQGGMMPGYYLRFLGGASKVATFVGLAPSNHGTTLSGITELLNVTPFAEEVTNSLAEDIGAPALVQQEQGSAFMKHLFANGDTVAGPRYVVIETSHDEVVTPYTNAFLKGATNILLQSQCPTDPVAHIGMFEDSPAMQNVLNQLSATPSSSFRAACSNFGAGI